MGGASIARSIDVERWRLSETRLRRFARGGMTVRHPLECGVHAPLWSRAGTAISIRP